MFSFEGFHFFPDQIELLSYKKINDEFWEATVPLTLTDLPARLPGGGKGLYIHLQKVGAFTSMI